MCYFTPQNFFRATLLLALNFWAMPVIIFRFLSHFPLSFLHALGAALGYVVYLSSPTYRKRLRKNIEGAGFGSSLSSAIREAGKGILELAFIWCAPPARVLKSARIENWDVVQAALGEKRGIIFLTPHLGCFEILAQAIAERFAARPKLTVMFRPPRKKALKPLIEGARARENLLLAPANLAGVRIMARALRNGEAIGLLPDQVPDHGEGVWADFFGRPAYTMTLSAKLQRMSGAPLILSYAERLPHGAGFVLHFVRFEEKLGDTPEEQAHAINRAMEELISRCPAQYLWSYNRYKEPRGTPANSVESKA